MLKVLHYCAQRMSDFAIRLHGWGGAIECWCDERTMRKRSKHRILWAWAKGHGYMLVDLPLTKDLDPEDLVMPGIDAGTVSTRPKPITLLDEGE